MSVGLARTIRRPGPGWALNVSAPCTVVRFAVGAGAFLRPRFPSGGCPVGRSSSDSRSGGPLVSFPPVSALPKQLPFPLPSSFNEASRSQCRDLCAGSVGGRLEACTLVNGVSFGRAVADGTGRTFAPLSVASSCFRSLLERLPLTACAQAGTGGVQDSARVPAVAPPFVSLVWCQVLVVVPSLVGAISVASPFWGLLFSISCRDDELSVWCSVLGISVSRCACPAMLPLAVLPVLVGQPLPLGSLAQEALPLMLWGVGKPCLAMLAQRRCPGSRLAARWWV